MKKERDYYTINKELYIKFIDHIEKYNINKSKFIEKLIKDYMDKFKE